MNIFLNLEIGELPIASFSEEVSLWMIGESGENLVSTSANKTFVPLFEIARNPKAADIESLYENGLLSGVRDINDDEEKKREKLIDSGADHTITYTRNDLTVLRADEGFKYGLSMSKVVAILGWKGGLGLLESATQ